MMLPKLPVVAALFDLDGTLVDSAPDLIVAMRRLRNELGEPERDLGNVGPVVSKGGRAMLRQGFPDADEARVEELLPRFLALYSQAIATHSRPFAGIEVLLAKLESRGVPWGVVTNKPGWLASALLAALALDKRCAVLVAGDTLAQRKPQPEPIRHACRIVGVDVLRSVYVGDDARDIEAGRNAGSMTVAAAWGYLNGEDPHAWGADVVLAAPTEMIGALALD